MTVSFPVVFELAACVLRPAGGSSNFLMMRFNARILDVPGLLPTLQALGEVLVFIWRWPSRSCWTPFRRSRWIRTPQPG